MRVSRRYRWLVILLLGAVTGCSSGFGVVDAIGNGDDGNIAGHVADLSHHWRVAGYSSVVLGAVVPAAETQFDWTFYSDLTFKVSSNVPVKSGADQTTQYDFEGGWVIVDATHRQLQLWITRRDGEPVAAGQQTIVSGVWTFSGDQLILSTTVLGPDAVRYVMNRVSD